MSRRIEIGFGIGFHGNHEPLAYTSANDATIIYKASKLFGGCTLIPVKGGWQAPDTGIMQEDGRVLRIDNVDATRIDEAKTLAAWIKAYLGQTSVVFSTSIVQTEFV